MSWFNPAAGYHGPGGSTFSPRDPAAATRALRARQDAAREAKQQRNIDAGTTRYEGARDTINNVIDKGYIDDAQRDRAQGRYDSVLGNVNDQYGDLRELQERGLLNDEEMQMFMDQMGISNTMLEDLENGGVDQSNYDFATGNIRDSIGSINNTRDKGMYTGEEFDSVRSNANARMQAAGKNSAQSFFNTPGGSGILGPAGAASAMSKFGVEGGRASADAFADLTRQQAQSRVDAANDSVNAGKGLGDLALRYGDGQRDAADISSRLAGTMSDFLLGHGQGRIDAAGLLDRLIAQEGGFADKLAGLDTSTMPAWLKEYLQDQVNDQQTAEGQMNKGTGFKGGKRDIRKGGTGDLDFGGYGSGPSVGSPSSGGPVGSTVQQPPAGTGGMSITLPQAAPAGLPMGGSVSPLQGPSAGSGGLTMMNPRPAPVPVGGTQPALGGGGIALPKPGSAAPQGRAVGPRPGGGIGMMNPPGQQKRRMAPKPYGMVA